MAEGKERDRGALARATQSQVSRRKFMALAGGSAAAAALLAACGSGGGDDDGGTSQFGDGDVGILNYALTLEYLATAFYADIVKSGFFKGAVLTTMRKFGEEEGEHVAGLTKAIERLGGDPTAEPKTAFPLKGPQPALELASELENLGAAAYLGQVPKIEDTAALSTVLSIHSIEGKHAAAINTMLGTPITPDGAFAKPATAEAVLESVEPYIAD
jgi:Ferritin-like domain